jgi:hypothetical protein
LKWSSKCFISQPQIAKKFLKASKNLCQAGKTNPLSDDIEHGKLNIPLPFNWILLGDDGNYVNTHYAKDIKG